AARRVMVAYSTPPAAVVWSTEKYRVSSSPAATVPKSVISGESVTRPTLTPAPARAEVLMLAPAINVADLLPAVTGANWIQIVQPSWAARLLGQLLYEMENSA